MSADTDDVVNPVTKWIKGHKVISFVVGLLFFGVFIPPISFFWFVWIFGAVNDPIAAAGQYGDAFGPLGTLLTGVSVLFLGWTLYDQRKAIDHQRKAMEAARNDNADDRHMALFLEIIKNIKDQSQEQIVTIAKVGTYKGKSFFEVVPGHLKSITFQQIDEIVIREVREIAKQLLPLINHVDIASKMAKDDPLLREMLVVSLPKNFKATINSVMNIGVQSKKVHAVTKTFEGLPKWLWEKLAVYEDAD